MRRREFLAGLGGVVAATAVRGAEAAVAKYGCGYVQFVFTYGSLAQVDGLRAAIERRLRGLKRP